jgi:hypothetical protein
VLQVLDFGFTKSGRPYVATPFVHGADLGQELRAGGSWTLAELLRAAREVALVLSAVHRLHLALHELKPENVLQARGIDGERAVVLRDLAMVPFHEGSARDIRHFGRIFHRLLSRESIAQGWHAGEAGDVVACAARDLEHILLRCAGTAPDAKEHGETLMSEVGKRIELLALRLRRDGELLWGDTARNRLPRPIGLVTDSPSSAPLSLPAAEVPSGTSAWGRMNIALALLGGSCVCALLAAVITVPSALPTRATAGATAYTEVRSGYFPEAPDAGTLDAGAHAAQQRR